jgi:hypothetical protein
MYVFLNIGGNKQTFLSFLVLKSAGYKSIKVLEIVSRIGFLYGFESALKYQGFEENIRKGILQPNTLLRKNYLLI